MKKESKTNKKLKITLIIVGVLIISGIFIYYFINNSQPAKPNSAPLELNSNVYTQEDVNNAYSIIKEQKLKYENYFGDNGEYSHTQYAVGDVIIYTPFSATVSYWIPKYSSKITESNLKQDIIFSFNKNRFAFHIVSPTKTIIDKIDSAKIIVDSKEIYPVEQPAGMAISSSEKRNEKEFIGYPITDYPDYVGYQLNFENYSLIYHKPIIVKVKIGEDNFQYNIDMSKYK